MTTQTATPGPIKSGRPSKDDTAEKFWDGKLYAMLLKALPQHVEGGRLSPVKLAAAIKRNRFTVYKWLKYDRVSPKGAKLLIDEAGGKLKAQDLTPFVIS